MTRRACGEEWTCDGSFVKVDKLASLMDFYVLEEEQEEAICLKLYLV